MSPETLEALKHAYAAMLRDYTPWRMYNQTFYCILRGVIADASKLPEETVQQVMEEFVAITPRS